MTNAGWEVVTDSSDDTGSPFRTLGGCSSPERHLEHRLGCRSIRSVFPAARRAETPEWVPEVPDDTGGDDPVKDDPPP